MKSTLHFLTRGFQHFHQCPPPLEQNLAAWTSLLFGLSSFHMLKDSNKYISRDMTGAMHREISRGMKLDAKLI